MLTTHVLSIQRNSSPFLEIHVLWTIKVTSLFPKKDYYVSKSGMGLMGNYRVQFCLASNALRYMLIVTGNYL